ncbi:putative disease resistance protein At3g14460 [Telopea speciosissima]|uniref:putative disease resistance protein At3g14460 n=1 Tax=Telopea speciosissima TaxID=54955 RepID=UPI001CC3878F|nr:putative disease resistance protein At3g14460 [Telopea speciosissima]
MDNLTCLQSLNRFVVGSKNSSKLREMSQLRGTLDIVNLENVGNSGIETMVANLKNKLNLLRRQLKWRNYESHDSFPDLGRDEKAEEYVLEKLQPPTNLEVLWIQNYGGTNFPSWMEHPSFSNLKTVHLTGCRNCMFLPRLNQLPLLEHLEIKFCSATKMVGSGLHEDGSSSTNKKFRSLKTLYIEGMEEWEEWLEVVEEEKEGGGQFPCLRKLIIKYCPRLRMFSHRFPGLVRMEIVRCHDLRELPRLLPSLQCLRLRECPKLAVISSLPSVKKLTLNSCGQITSLSNSNRQSSSAPRVHISFPCLHVLQIVSYPMDWMCWTRDEVHLSWAIDDDVSDLESLHIGVMQHLTALEELKIYDCKLLTVPLQNEIGGFDLLPSSLQLLYICFDCDNLGKLAQSMCNLHRLKELRIDGARGLTSSVEVLHNLTSLTSLQEFVIESCHALVSFQETGLPTSFQELKIIDCENLKSLPKELHTLTSLQEFVIENCPALVSFQETRLPTSLRKLEIIDCKNLESLPKELHTLTSLQEFVIKSCPALVSFQEIALPTLLRKLEIIDCKNLESLPKELHTLTPLQEFVIKSCPALVSFQEIALPTSLRGLEIIDCKNLESLPGGLYKLTSLRTLRTEECPALESFPDMGLPIALQNLSIQKCGKLNSLPKALHKLTNLEQLKIVGCSFLMECKSLEPLQTSGLHNLTSLSDLTVGGCPALVSIPKGLLPTNLWEFCIKDCPILESLYDGLSDLTSLKGLHIQNCPMLKQRYQKKEGEEWSKIIAQVHYVAIDSVPLH